jgi:CheY-like chemotaxis protein
MNQEQEGFRVLSSNSPAEALTRWQSRRDQIDLLITDMRMPWIDGPLLARWLAMDDPGVPVLFISGEGDTSELNEFKNCGFLAKPFSPFDTPDRSQPAAEARRSAVAELNRSRRLNFAEILSESPGWPAPGFEINLRDFAQIRALRQLMTGCSVASSACRNPCLEM